MNLGRLVEFTSGELISRLQDHGNIDSEPGEYELFSVDQTSSRFLHSQENLEVIRSGQLILGLAQQQIYVPQQLKPPLLLTANFAAITVSSKINAMFLSWWFNESSEAQRQKFQIAQSASAVLTRLTLQDVKKMSISLPTSIVQQRIGEIYANRIREMALLAKKSKLVDQRASALIDQIWRRTNA